SHSYVTNLLNGEIKADEASHTAVANLADSLGVSMEWLSRGVGPMGAHENTENGAVQISRFPERVPPGYVRLMQFGEEVGAGSGILNRDGDVEILRYVDIAQWWASQHLPRNLDSVRVLGVRGDSMAPLINDGDVVFVD